MAHKKKIHLNKKGWQMLADRFESKNEISRQMSLGKAIVRRELDRHGVTCGHRQIPFGWISRYEGFDTERDMFYHYYHVLDIGAACIGEYLGLYIGKYYIIPKSTILKTMKDCGGIPFKKQGGANNIQLNKTKDNFDKIKVLDFVNMTTRQIMEATELTKGKVYHAIKMYG